MPATLLIFALIGDRSAAGRCYLTCHGRNHNPSAIDAFEQRVLPHEHASVAALVFGDVRMRRDIRRFRQLVDRQALAPIQHDEVIVLAAERATLLRRMAFLDKTRRLFELWHVFHLPLVYVMFAIVAVHVAVTMYMGYIPFLD